MTKSRKSTTNFSSTPPPSFPNTRMRRNRKEPWVRNLVEENRLSTHDLIYPVFIIEGKNRREKIDSMPDVERTTIDILLKTAENALEQGIPALALFPVIDSDKKNITGKEALNSKNLICSAIRELKKTLPEMGLICDIALDPYTIHGHDGIVDVNGKVINDETISMLCKQALVQAEAGADIVAPSDMMDGRIGAIRTTLDKNGFQDTSILSYAAKYASSFYGPFRDAVNSKNLLKGDKKTYQMNPANSDEALREVALDIQEGADMIMVKPGLPYLDIIQRVKENFAVPTFSYQVSGEYSMMKAADKNGWLSYEQTMMESLISLKRAGSDSIFTYAALDAARIIKNNI